MPIVKTQGYQLDSPQQNFVRDSFPTLADMLAYDTAMLPPVFHSMVDEDGKLYTYWENNEVDPVLGKWRLGAGGDQGGDTLNVDELPDPSSCQEGDLVNVRADYEKPIQFDVIRDHYGEPYRMVTSKELEDLVKPGNWDYTVLQTIDLTTGDWFWELLDENLMNFPIACHWTRGYVTSDGYVYNFTYNETPVEGQSPITFTKDKHPELQYLTEIYLCAVNSEDVTPEMSIVSTHNIDNMCFVAGQTLIDPVVPEPEIKQYKAGLYRLVDGEWKFVKIEVNVDRLPDPSCYSEGDIVNLNNRYDECITDDVVTKKYGWPWRSMSLEEAEVFIKNWTWDTVIIRPNPSVDPIYVIRATRQFATHIPNFFVDYGEKILTNTFGTFITNDKGTTGRQDLSIVEDDTYPDFYENTLMLAVCDYTQHPEYAAPGVGYFFRYVDTGPGDSEGLCINAQCVAEWNKEWESRPGPGGGVYKRDYYYAYGKEEPFENTEAGEYIVGQSYTYEIRNYEAGVYRLTDGVWVKEEYGKTFDLDELPDPSEYTEGDVVNIRQNVYSGIQYDTDDSAIYYLADLSSEEPYCFTPSLGDFDDLYHYYNYNYVENYNNIDGLNGILFLNDYNEQLFIPFVGESGTLNYYRISDTSGFGLNEDIKTPIAILGDAGIDGDVVYKCMAYPVRPVSYEEHDGWIKFGSLYWAPNNVGATCDDTRQSWYGYYFPFATNEYLENETQDINWNLYRYCTFVGPEDDPTVLEIKKYNDEDIDSGLYHIEQKFEISGPELLYKAGLYKLINGQWERIADVRRKEFTTAEWAALTLEQKRQYDGYEIIITDDVHACANGVLTGSVIAWTTDNIPLGYLLCDGRTLDNTVYKELFDVIGYTYGGNGVDKFNIPDYREVVLVGAGTNETNTIANHDVYTLNQFSDDQMQQHTHNYNVSAGLSSSGLGVSVGSNRSQGRDGGSNGRTGTTTHGKQKGVNYIIKYTSIELNQISFQTLENSMRAIQAQIEATMEYQYSTTVEVYTGRKWIDGKKIYALAVDCPNLSASSGNRNIKTLWGPTTACPVDKFISVRGSMTNNSDYQCIEVNYMTNFVGYIRYTAADGVFLYYATPWAGDYHFVIEYTKKYD